MSLSISKEVRGEVAVIHAEGDLDVYTAPRLKEAIDAASSAGSRLVVDLTDVHFIDSTALGVLVAAHQRSKSDGHDFRLVVEDPFLLKIFRITGFDGVFSIFSQLNDALSYD